MKIREILLATGMLVSLSSCFVGADSYEKEVNEYFFLHREYGTQKTYLGTIEDGGYRMANGYLGPVSQIGWNDAHVIVKDKHNRYYIQPIRAGASLAQVQRELKGPFTYEEFQVQRVKSAVDESLAFELEY
ncbi:MAG: hypothetical protein ICV83_03505 [Cytophagales bacterium]|nr:hypothetical protein [Cytophagales bacterium]